MAIIRLESLRRSGCTRVQQKGLNLYGKKLIRLPVPKLVTFYNGLDDAEDCILQLSDAFAPYPDVGEADIQVRVRIININYGKNEHMLSSCRPLKEYAWLVARIRENQQAMAIGAAVDRAIQEMPDDFETRQFLIGHRAEVKDMCITEYNEAQTLQMIREEGREAGQLEMARKMAFNMLKDGEPMDKIARFLEYPPETILSWVEKS